jgi:hypothetical protein
MTCSNNLKQIALAAHNYEGAIQSLPPGSHEIYGHGPITQLLPYLEQDNIYKGYNQITNTGTWYNVPAGSTLINRPPSTGTLTIPRPPDRYGAEGEIKSLQCPAAPSPSSYKTVTMTNEYGTAGVDYNSAIGASPRGHVFSSAPGSVVLGRSNYVAVAGDWRYGPGYHGMFYYRTPNKLAAIPDGTSNTLMFGEMNPGLSPFTGDALLGGGPVTAAWGCQGLYTAFGVASTIDSWGVFGSRHTNLILFAFGDGSVRPLTNPTQFNVNPGFSLFTAMAGTSDGVVLTNQ